MFKLPRLNWNNPVTLKGSRNYGNYRVKKTYSEEISLADHYQYNYKAKRNLSGCVTFFWNPEYNEDYYKEHKKNSIVCIKFEPLDEYNLVIKKFLVVDGNGRVISHKKKDKYTYTFKMCRPGTLKYWIPIQQHWCSKSYNRNTDCKSTEDEFRWILTEEICERCKKPASD